MPRKLSDRPPRTPNPDEPHSTASDRKKGDQPASGAAPPEEPSPEEATYDSCFDDVTLVLSQSIEEPRPDPNLGPTSTEAACPSPNQPVPPFLQDRGKQPRTSEI